MKPRGLTLDIDGQMRSECGDALFMWQSRLHTWRLPGGGRQNGG